ncbi:MAG: hypothetical protein Q8R83_02570 [Legionellaceae bacterium]|nr:hypothetical protein [Legionellaceae bacterium]
MISAIYKKAGVFLSIFLIVILMAPTVQSILKICRESTPLYGYTDPLPEKPKNYVASFFNKSLQEWVEKKFNARLGFHPFLVRSFNELNFRLFREADSTYLKLMVTKQHGLYSNLSIDCLNDEVMRKQVLEKIYTKQAKQLIKIQNNLAAQGKYFAVVIATSKAYVYPDELGSRFLVGGSTNIFNRKANFGAILKRAGVHVIDSRPLLNKIAHTLKIETHPTSGVHWNYYSGCLIANKILANAQTKFPSITEINCGPSQRMVPVMNAVDVDGYLLLNIWSHAGLIQETTYPTIEPATHPATHWRPNIVFIGDSFSDQIRSAFKEAGIYSRMVMSSYFKQREVDNPQDIITSDDDKSIKRKVLADIAASDIIILEMVDYNISRNLYGFADYYLKHA